MSDAAFVKRCSAKCWQEGECDGSCKEGTAALRPLDPRRMHHAYGGVEHASRPPVDGCLLCRLEAVADAWFNWRQSDLDALLHEYRRDDD